MNMDTLEERARSQRKQVEELRTARARVASPREGGLSLVRVGPWV